MKTTFQRNIIHTCFATYIYFKAILSGSLSRGVCVGLSLSVTSVVVVPALVDLTVVARLPSEMTIRKLWKNRGLLLTWFENYTAHLGPHSEVTRRQGELERAQLRVQLLLGLKVGASGFMVSLFIGEFKVRTEIYGAGREKTRGPNGQLLKSINQDF